MTTGTELDWRQVLVWATEETGSDSDGTPYYGFSDERQNLVFVALVQEGLLVKTRRDRFKAADSDTFAQTLVDRGMVHKRYALYVLMHRTAQLAGALPLSEEPRPELEGEDDEQG